MSHDAMEGVHRLVEGPQLVPGNAEPGEGIKPPWLTCKDPLEVSGCFVVPPLLESRSALQVGRRATGQNRGAHDEGKGNGPLVHDQHLLEGLVGFTVRRCE